MVLAEESEVHGAMSESRAALQSYLVLLDEAQHQIEVSASESVALVNQTLDDITSQVLSAISQRRATLLDDVSRTKQQALDQVQQCRVLAAEQAGQSADDGVSCAESADPGVCPADAHPSPDILADLPSPSALPRLEVRFPAAVTSSLLTSLRRLGAVETTVCVGPVRTEARPGAVLVRWHDGEDEADSTDCLYRLQYCYGDASQMAAPLYHLAYEGPEQSCLVRRLRCDVSYSFRVSRQMAGESSWSAWSPPVVGKTNLPHYEWCPSSEYMLTDSNRIACKTGPGDASVLFSRSPDLHPGHEVRLVVVEAGAGCSDEGVALVDGTLADTSAGLAAKGTLFVSATGEVYVDGQRRQMRLPPLVAGTKVTFLTERHGERTRVFLDADDKQVVYDWRTRHSNLRLAASFNERGWKLLIE